MIKISGLCKIISGHEILSDINLEISDGEIFGFLGPNGAGKSTTVNILSGLELPDSGTVLINGMEIVAEEASVKKITGHLPELPVLYENLTGREFLWFIGGLYSINKAALSKKIESLFGFFELTPFADQLSRNYPKGIRQKFGLCAALINDPQVLILDEPTSSLDPKSAKLVKVLLKRFRDEKKTIFITTHVLEIAEALCDRLAIIQQGRIIACGTIPELRTLSEIEFPLEEIFLKLTGGVEYETLLRYLRE
ncbi:MAG: ABC transporter ATP-binding protein [Candidatus Wallbacteria bacterium]|nr:ABC transporter ATP-binding protein [Candidatus Wallbacteria bacterium]